jgi:hypothetical protein
MPRHFEDDLARHRCAQPRALGDLALELTGAPARVPEQEPYLLRRMRGHLPQHFQGSREEDTICHGSGLGSHGVCDLVAEDHPARLRLHRPSPVDDLVGAAPPFDLERGAEVRSIDPGGPVQYDAEGTVLVVMHEEDDGALEVRVEQLRHRNEEGRCEGRTGHVRRVAGTRETPPHPHLSS